MTWTDMATGLWTMAEVQTAVVSANLPCMRPLYTIFSAKVRGVRHTYHSKEDGTTNTKREFHSGGFRRMSDNLNRGPVGLSSTVRAMRANLELEMGLPIHGISVITDVEQRVDNMSELSDSSETGINPPAVPWREPTVSSGMV
ncbi:hypothetical protein MMC17_000139 [Xylographa soralifera]|nr:hypothetical protein [Xylographa soralifera]